MYQQASTRLAVRRQPHPKHENTKTRKHTNTRTHRSQMPVLYLPLVTYLQRQQPQPNKGDAEVRAENTGAAANKHPGGCPNWYPAQSLCMCLR